MNTLYKVFQLDTDGNTLVVSPQGDTTKFRYNDIQSELNRLLGVLQSPTISNVLVDFGSVSVVGTTVINSLVRVLRQRPTGGGQAAICNASPEMRGVLKDLNLDKVWPYFATRDEALQTFQHGPSDSSA